MDPQTAILVAVGVLIGQLKQYEQTAEIAAYLKMAEAGYTNALAAHEAAKQKVDTTLPPLQPVA